MTRKASNKVAFYTVENIEKGKDTIIITYEYYQHLKNSGNLR